MKKMLLSLKAIALCFLLCAQAPHTFNYQAVVRNLSGQVVSDSKVAVRFTIHDGSASGPAVFTELQNATTNQFGLVTVALGAVTNGLDGVNWALGEKYLQVEMDIANKGTFADMGTSQLLSVPYAFYAGKAGSVANGNEKTLSDDNISWNCKTHTLTIDNQSVNVTNCDGTFGPTGPTGPTGATGVAGAKGATGSTGAQGAAGVAGAKGATGSTGAQGPAGVAGATGAAGVAGAKGATGSTGSQGPAGVAGPQGAAGPAGAQGVAGPAGAQGAQGIQGATGAQGIQGPIGPQGIAGPQGGQGVQGIPGVTGPQGIQGPAGANGTNGTNGAQGVTGAQGPAGNNGNDGVAGPAGVTGANGATGPQGLTGNDGAPGATGPAGVTGANGPTGPQGPAGNDGVGATGPTGPAGNGASLPNGTSSGQILMWDGTQWVSSTICAIFGSDVNNCGSCGHVCNLPNATSTCNNGQCAILNCNSGFADCNGIASDGCEVNLNGDPANCGTCGSLCSFPNATAACTGGGCILANCNAGFANCDNNVANGCEVNLEIDFTNCGSCGRVCPIGPNSYSTCVGYCQLNCFGGFGNCDGNPYNGCEVNLSFDPANCAGCGHVCYAPNATVGCSSGNCTITSCLAGFEDCDALFSDGCEVNITNSVSNCGSCGTVCFVINGTPGCSNGACTVSSCNAGYANCDNIAANGCETYTAADVNNCGTCGNVCYIPNGTPGCSSGGCTVASCNAGYNDCDRNVSDGCEVNINADPNNCGSCGAVCNLSNAIAGCGNGACTIISCNTGFANCDNNAINGCETNISSNFTNCGSCGNVCYTPNATAGCAGGSCYIQYCSAGFANCDNVTSNGCEANIETSPENCGSCGSVCYAPNATSTCTGGACYIASCSAGYANCDGQFADGCEVNIENSHSNCGSCGFVCQVAQTCVNGSCH